MGVDFASENGSLQFAHGRKMKLLPTGRSDAPATEVSRAAWAIDSKLTIATGALDRGALVGHEGFVKFVAGAALGASNVHGVVQALSGASAGS